MYKENIRLLQGGEEMKHLLTAFLILLLIASISIQVRGKEKEEYIEIECEITAYCHGNITSTGTVPHKGVVAVDPDYIPYGSKLYIPGYGWAVAEDCGGAITGWMIDIFLLSEYECYQWGRKFKKVRIYKR